MSGKSLNFRTSGGKAAKPAHIPVQSAVFSFQLPIETIQLKTENYFSLFQGAAQWHERLLVIRILQTIPIHRQRVGK
jgi:hypothetical protein